MKAARRDRYNLARVLTFSQPVFLALLLLIPLSILIAWPRLAQRRRVAALAGARPVAGGPASRSGLIWDRHTVIGALVRCGLIALIALAMAGAQLVTLNRRLSVVFLVDASDSVGAEGRDLAADFVADALRSMRPAGQREGPLDSAAVVVFGADAQIERAMTGLRDLQPFGAQVRSGGTNVENAVRLGLSLLPNDTARRLVLLSDGLPTSGDAEAAARLARAANARLDVVALPSTTGPDAAIERLDVPQRASAGQVIPVQVVVRSSLAQRAQLTLFAGPDLVGQQDVNLLVGQNTFSIRVTAARAGLSAIRASLSVPQDGIPQNNTLSAAIVVGGPPRILLVAGAPGRGAADEVAPLKAALRAAEIAFDETTAGAMPTEIQSLAEYQSLVLANVPARDLSQRAMFSIQSYVRDIGGGLVVIGGPNSYGVGGYFKTPLEETLPVEMQVRDPKRFPSIAMVIVMDKSGSMGALENGAQKMRLAAEAAARAVELLNEDDEVTVIAFDTLPVDVIGPFNGRDRAAYIPRIVRIGVGGGGIYIKESLDEAARVLAPTTRLTKFVILLADGSDSEHQPGARELVAQMRARNITLSVVAIGDGSDVPFLRDIARIGEGRFHLTNRAANLPNIFTEETALAQRSYIIEEPFFPKLGAASPILAGISAVPQLRGYVASTPKPSAQVILRASETDPLLATWQYGLGRAVAFTSDATTRWGQPWVNWAEYPRFWAQAIRWTILDRLDSGAQAKVTSRGDRAVIEADLPAARAAQANEARLRATLIDADGITQTVPMVQTAPGHFEVDAPLTLPGAYLVRVESLDAAGEATLERAIPYARPYSAEYAPAAASGQSALEAWASLGGGARLTMPAQAFELNVPAAAARTDLFPILMLFATLLLPFDVAARRIVISVPGLLERLFARRRGLAPQMALANTERMGRLMAAKRKTVTSADAPVEAPLGRASLRAELQRLREQPAQYAIEEGAEAPPPAVNAAAELLRRRRERKGKPPEMP